MRFSQQFLEEIKNRLPLSNVVGRRVTWDKRKSQPGKGDFWACCPFHSEKTPSFHVDERRNRYKCFGCGESGDHFRFVCETEGLSFPEAVEQLAGEAGVAMPAPDPQAARKQEQRKSLGEVCELAADYYRKQFWGPIGDGALRYARSRGLSDATLREFQFGFAPAGRDNLKQHLLDKGIKEGQLVEAGLVIRPDDGRASYDRFRNRLMIPIHDERGRPVAFGGRTMDPKGQPKYLNSPETPIFHKGTMLFNSHRARQPAYEASQAVVVEGYMDAIAVWQAGLKGVVASLGTAFTEDQILRLWKFADEPVICFDGDAAGVSAAHRAVDRVLPVLTSGKSFQFVFLPDGQDPDDLLNEGGLPALEAELAKAQPLSEVVWERETTLARLDTPERRAALEKALEDLVDTIRDERVKKRYRMDLRVRLSNLFWENSRPQRGASGRAQSGWEPRGGKGARVQQRVDAPGTKNFGVERTLCAMAVKYPELFERHFERLGQVRFSSELHQAFMLALCTMAEDRGEASIAESFGALGEKFFQILQEVQGGAGEEGAVAKGVSKWSDLYDRAPVLQLDPPEDFVEQLFVLNMDLIELHQLESELEGEMALAETELSEAGWVRIQGLTQDLSRRKEECIREEQQLAERAQKMRARGKLSVAHG
ncbi:DNA primase [Polycladidibacter hongkongensis]|uniref:DNA primase n=1 Tax=Polycladidibacter hongkongensis TaxID=1647556 RepID=UPI00082C29B1|nr:DNA primase [Pseudovibrio hongkongensis]